MDAFLRSLQGSAIQTDAYGFVTSISVSFVSAVVVALLYNSFFENRRRGAQAHRFFLVGGPAITAMLLAIQFSLPLSLGLLGALSIIRFRTPVKEPEEVAYIMLLIALSITAATFNFILTFILLATATFALVVQRLAPVPFIRKKKNGTLLLSFADQGTASSKEGVEETLKSFLPRGRIESLAASDGLTSYHYSFESTADFDFDKALPEIRKRLSPSKINIFFAE